MISDTVRRRYHDLLNVYDKIIVCCGIQKNDLDLIVKCVNAADHFKKVLMLSDTKSGFISTNKNLQVYQISTEEKEGLLDLYYMYEFSDRITIMTHNPQYPSILHYLSAGLLTTEDLAKAFLQ